jgi:Domain of unknown function (DUF4384)
MENTMKRLLSILTLLFLINSAISAEAPNWVSSYGVNTPYPTVTYISGFSMVSKSEPGKREMAMDKALADLSKKIKIQIQSELVMEESQRGDDFSSSVSSVTRSSVNTTVSDAKFEFFEDRKYIYCLAFAHRESLKQLYSEEASEFWSSASVAYKEALRYSEKGNGDKALEKLYDDLTDFSEIYERWSLYKALNKETTDKAFFQSMRGAEALDEIQVFEARYEELMDEIESSDAVTLKEGLEKMAQMLVRQNVTGGNLKVPAFLYESTSISSEFGRYTGDLFESDLVEELSPGKDKVVIKGQYWIEDEKIRLIAIAMNSEGKKLGKADVLIPRSAAGSRELKPQNFEQAMIDRQQFADGALTDGGINLDVWSNKGEDDEDQVFTDGDTLQLYFRVNQPAYLQLTYSLATGEKILLEPSFYIGMDQVNRAVALPYEFEVQAPFGIETLFVTAYTTQPPVASTYPVTIEGESYDVFGTVKDVVMNTRGIGKKPNSVNRYGEAMLNMTMLPSE